MSRINPKVFLMTDNLRFRELDRIKPITDVHQIPKTAHYAVLISKSRTINHEGDERSRTNPGHGYPAYSEQILSIEYYDFLNKEQVLEFIQYRTGKAFDNTNINDIRVQHVESTISPQLKVDINISF